MTLHSAKGLEFPHVFLAGVEEDMLPHKRAVSEGDSAIEEERRLFYVGITRAQKVLTITHAAARSLYGEQKPRQPSRFLLEVAKSGLLVSEIYSPKVEVSEEDVQGYLEQFRRLRARTST